MRTHGPNLFPTVAVLTLLITISVPAHCLQCRFKLATYTYDLCPLLFTFDSSLSSIISSPRHIRIHKDTSIPPTMTRNIYDIDLGGEGLKKDPTLPATEQCPDGTWICLQISNILLNHPSKPRRIVQVIPVSGNIKDSILDEAPRPHGVNATARLVTPARTNEQTIPMVEITLNGGWYLSRPQRAVISFICDESITEPSAPVPKLFNQDISSPSPPLPLDETSDSQQIDSHGFTWNTKHACPIAQNMKAPDASQTAEAPSESSHTGKGNQGDEGNVSPEVPLSDGDGTRPVNLFKAAGIIIGSLLALAVCYEIYVTQIHRRKRYISLSRGGTSHAWLPSLGIIIPPLPSLSFPIPPFLNPFRRSSQRSFFGSRPENMYDPRFAEEYEIQDEEGGGTVVDFQRQGLLQGPASDNGYGSVR